MRFTNKIIEKMATNPKLFEIADTLSKLTVLEAKELVRILEEDYGIKGAEKIAEFKPAGTEPVPEVEQTEFSVYLKESGGQKLQVIKKVKEIMGLGLKESKELVDSAPCLLREKILKVEAETLRTELQNLGATVEVK
jgi:large subunit ribosomal protein L7/L12